MTHVLTLIGLLAASSQATELALPDFETAIKAVRTQVMATRAAQAQAKYEAVASDLDRLAMDTRSLQWKASRYRNDLSDLRRRAQRLQPHQPGQPANDPFFRNDLNRVVWNLRDFEWEIERIANDAQQIARSAQADPTLVAAARRFVDAFTWTENEIGWVASEARWARWDIDRAGYTFEAWDIERYASDSDREIRDAHRAADEILRKVSQPPPQPPQP
ncbi:MAG: hypothetical protein HY927_15785 [Elusimicrobia bacterium]|nr:hypothetical protein [Elusimicrobiota bacterium]